MDATPNFSLILFFHSASTPQKCVDQDSWKYSRTRDNWAIASNPRITSRLHGFTVQPRLAFTFSLCKWWAKKSLLLHHWDSSELIHTFYVGLYQIYILLSILYVLYLSFLWLLLFSYFMSKFSGTAFFVYASYRLTLIRSLQITSPRTGIFWLLSCNLYVNRWITESLNCWFLYYIRDMNLNLSIGTFHWVRILL